MCLERHRYPGSGGMAGITMTSEHHDSEKQNRLVSTSSLFPMLCLLHICIFFVFSAVNT